jgi:hypothetical protein
LNVFILFWDTSHMKSDKPDACLVEYPGWENTAGWLGTRELPLPDRIVFEAKMDVVRATDYPVNDVNWPLVSPKMRETLRAVGPLPRHREIPVLMVDRDVPVSRRVTAPGRYRSEVVDDRFAALHLLEHADAFDWERSEYEKHPQLPNRIKKVKRLVLQAPAGGLPPIFRLSAYPKRLLVREDARDALDRAGVRGAVFWPLDRA